jgi:hypothetical protein
MFPRQLEEEERGRRRFETEQRTWSMEEEDESAAGNKSSPAPEATKGCRFEMPERCTGGPEEHFERTVPYPRLDDLSATLSC